MSNLIRTRRAMTSTPSLTTTPTIATTTPAEMDHRLVNPVDPVGPPVPQAQASLTFSVALPVSALCTQQCPRTTNQMSPSRSIIDASGTQPAKKNTWGPCRQLKTAKVTRVTNGRIPIKYDGRHRAAPTVEQHSALAHDIGHVMRTFCPMRWKSWKAMPEETKNTTNYNLEDMDDDMFAYLNRLISESYKQWKNDMHQCFQQFDDPRRQQDQSGEENSSPPFGFEAFLL
ncbi:hypothetical protein C1H46_006750 [Malus baccata]|uniref:Uncharacterized protein n=1 Tax=Malus baccata TaxID=106549 RepID=A0A540N993_MALBA|nr:hypothetical protein C1H46_006750 [Malus baccata]